MGFPFFFLQGTLSLGEILTSLTNVSEKQSCSCWIGGCAQSPSSSLMEAPGGPSEGHSENHWFRQQCGAVLVGIKSVFSLCVNQW